MGRAVYFAQRAGLDMGIFYKRRDYTQIVNGRNPIVAHEFLEAAWKEKKMIIVDVYDLFRRKHAGRGEGA